MKLVEMSEIEFLSYIDAAIDSYTKELINSKRFPTEKEANDFAMWEYKEDIFKEGYHTEHTFVFNLVAEKKTVGIIWILMENGIAFIGDFLVYPECQGQGFGSSALNQIESIAQSKGATAIRLGVFKHNSLAQKLYRKNGYATYKERETNYILEKALR
ncbi:GNAT family N-acetyltransferase [Candidatus Enterococcus clewellii]|nr:GNAT family N-acetyltransferase [Enterococcus sp. 9E7_DIV0242]